MGFSLSLGGSKAGLTMASQLTDTAGADSGSELTAGFVEIGNGNYYWNYASFADGFRGGVYFYEDGSTGTILAFAAINPEEAEYTDQKTSAAVTLGNDSITAAIVATGAIDADAIATDAIGAAEIATDAIGSAELAASAVTEIVTGVLTSAMTEAYAADAAAPTLAQILFQIWSMLAEKSVAATTVTTKKIDGTTTSMTFTLNDASTPTEITRAS